MSLLRRRTVSQLVEASAAPMSPEIMEASAAIVRDVRARGEQAVREYAARFDRLSPDENLVVGKPEMHEALRGISAEDRDRLTRIADRIALFGERQKEALVEFETRVAGGRAGHTVKPVRRAGCYAPGGRYPLPSSLLMTAVTARAAGVSEVWVACSRRDPIVLACAALAGAEGFLAAGGAQAIAAMAYGCGEVPPCDIVVGPGNAYATAAKRLVFGDAGIDAIAGPSELVVVADDAADAHLVAADLLAQAEHDPMALPVLVAFSERMLEDVETALHTQLATLPTARVARIALGNGGALLVRDEAEATAACDELAPEHLHLHLAAAADVAPRFANYGALFIGSRSAEVFGDYGIGPNHVLPTGRASRFSGGLSVFTFLRVRTWLALDDAKTARQFHEDTTWLARVEGLEAHARAAELRVRHVSVRHQGGNPGEEAKRV